jgi:hypothetical protein
LSPATNRNPFGNEGTNALFPIGGRPVLLVEQEARTLMSKTASSFNFLPVVVQPPSAICPAN